ncbi:hypothetical protein [Gandjariella thermophila]|uniref:Uncharacterized protein n=1 Tax=Gandjariella thermophila TaxID=1931992 RepID=A0A4D4JB77_9PSEU|nr:hypothetical protein [Gandjariella thermophila]GDY31639.1 hypothetical protein GTS_32720 [Gandjariella thermophila]
MTGEPPPFAVSVLFADGHEEPIEATCFAFTEQVSTEDGGRFRVLLDVTCRAAAPIDAGLRVELRLGPTDDPGWLVPGVFYRENRVPGCTTPFPRFTTAKPDPALLESDTWHLRADRCATPAVFGWDRTGGAALVTTERSPLGQSGVGFAMAGTCPVLRLHFPYREEPVVYDGSPQPRPADVPGHRWTPGETATLCFDVYRLGPDRHDYTGVLRDVHRRTAPADLGAVPWVSVAEAADLAAWGLYRWHYRPDPPVLLETAAFDRHALGERGDRPAMHVSWLSGAPYAAALLRHGRRRGNAEYVAAAGAVLDHIAGNLAPAGTFWAQWTAAGGWGAGWTPDPKRLHARTLGEAALFLLRAAVAERGAGRPRPEWESAVRSNLDVACAGQREDGAFGSAYHAADGSVLDWAGTAGMAWIPALVEAATAWHEPRYLVAARRAGYAYLPAVENEFLHGAPEDVDLAPTSEDGYLAVLGYLALSEHDGAPRWLAAAGRAADWTLTFRYTYDVAFPPHTLLGAYGFRSRGADQASPANQHLHSYGLICVPELFRLGTRTQDEYYLASARENLACFRQFVARADGDFNAYRGMVSERFYQTACYQPKGMLLTLSHAWCVGVLLHACEAAIEGGFADD